MKKPWMAFHFTFSLLVGLFWFYQNWAGIFLVFCFWPMISYLVIKMIKLKGEKVELEKEIRGKELIIEDQDLFRQECQKMGEEAVWAFSQYLQKGQTNLDNFHILAKELLWEKEEESKRDKLSMDSIESCIEIEEKLLLAQFECVGARNNHKLVGTLQNIERDLNAYRVKREKVQGPTDGALIRRQMIDEIEKRLVELKNNNNICTQRGKIVRDKLNTLQKLFCHKKLASESFLQ